MPYVPREVSDAVTGTYEAWLPYAAAIRGVAPSGDAADDSAFAGSLERIAALQAQIEHNRANPVFAAEGA